MNSRQTEAGDIIRYLVLDIDGCSLTSLLLTKDGKKIPNPRQDILSPIVVARGREGGFAGFYICTRRMIHTAFDAAFSDRILSLYKEDLSRDFDPKNLLTTYVARNLKNAMGIPLIEISNPDDLSKTAPVEPSAQCGYGYRAMTKGFEEKLIEINRDFLEKKSYSGYCRPRYLGDKHKAISDLSLAKTKNPLLKLIADHASVSNINKQVQLHYWDDEEFLCAEASKIPASDLPKNVSLQITQHSTHFDILKIMGEVHGSGPIPSLPASTSLIFDRMSISPQQINSQTQEPAVQPEKQAAVEMTDDGAAKVMLEIAAAIPLAELR